MLQCQLLNWYSQVYQDGCPARVSKLAKKPEHKQKNIFHDVNTNANLRFVFHLINIKRQENDISYKQEIVKEEGNHQI